MATFSNGTDTVTPVVIDGFTSESEAGTIVQPLIGSEDVAVTLRPASLRTGTYVLNMGTDEAASADAETLFRGAHLWTVTIAERATINMSFVVTGRVIRQLEDATRNVWFVRFDWQEVNP